VELSVTPPLVGVETSAVAQALARSHLRFDETPESYSSAWRRTALLEAVGDEAADPHEPGASSRIPNGAPSPTLRVIE
jgi:hypothetical protein